MHIVLTDVVTCPRCGPEFGLVVLADRIEDRHVLDGRLGCANCREEFAVTAGTADLRWGGGSPASSDPLAEEDAPPADAERPFRLAALLGVTGPAPPLLIAARHPGLVREVQGHVPDAGVVGISRVPPSGDARVGMGWVIHSDTLPFRSRSLSGVALATGDPLPLVAEALRCLRRGARLVVDPAPPGTADALRSAGAELLLEEERVAVAFDPRAG